MKCIPSESPGALPRPMVACHHPGRTIALIVWRKAAMGVALTLSMAQASHAQMAIPGAFAVNQDGSAGYSIPIQVPPGLAGVEPKLTLNYNSHASNGPLGMGWGISGFSSVTLCPQTVPQDGISAGVEFSSPDRYCLDGKRLVPVTPPYPASSYQSSTPFAKEVDDFSRIYNKGTYFLVKMPDGRTLEYGKTPDSLLQVTDGTTTHTRAWQLDKVTDSFGNYMTIAYTADAANGMSYPASVTYTANDTANPKLTATSSVVFNYDATRTDATVGYYSGYPIANRSLLKSIATYNGTQKILNYAFSYENGYDTGRERLTSVQVCDGAGATCLPATTMTFATTSAAGKSTEPVAVASFSAGTTLNTSTQDPLLLQSPEAAGVTNWFAVDYENKGRVGFVHFSVSDSAAMKMWHSNGNGTFAISTGMSLAGAGNVGSTASAIYPVDVNGDGMPDFVFQVSGCTKGVLVNNGSGSYSPAAAAPTVPCDSGQDLFVDANADGMTDFVHLSNPAGVYTPWVAVGDTTFNPLTRQYTSPDGGGSGVWLPLDWNNSGGQGFIHFVGSGGAYYHWVSGGNGYYDIWQGLTSTVDTTPATTGIWLEMDLNGDGLTDLVHIVTAAGASQGTAYVWINKGNTSFAVSAFRTTVDTVAPIKKTSNSALADAWLVVDYDGDGKPEILHMADSSGTFYVWKSDGIGGFTVTAHKRSDDTALTSGVWKAADITGTGVVDLVHFLNDNGDYKVWTMPRTDRDVPLSINNGAGVSYRFTEKTLPQILDADGSKGGSYTRAAASPYPATLTTVVPPIRVVTDSYETDGLGSDYHLGYNYGSARFDRTGRGFAGFEWFESIDVLTSLTHRTTFSQTFPYTGMVVSSTRGTSHSASDSLSKVVNSFACLNSVASTAGQPCTVAAGNIYYPFVTQTDVSAKDLDGTPLPMKRTSITMADMDLYGNAKKITETTLNADGSSNATEDFSQVTTRTFDNDATNWRLGRVLTSTVSASTGPATPAPVTPGVGSNLPPTAPAPKFPPQLLIPIITLILSD